MKINARQAFKGGRKAALLTGLAAAGIVAGVAGTSIGLGQQASSSAATVSSASPRASTVEGPPAVVVNGATPVVYGKTAAGQTYASGIDAYKALANGWTLPDLTQVYATDGVTLGYVPTRSVFPAPAKNPTDALAAQSARRVATSVPVVDLSGATVGTFALQ